MDRGAWQAAVHGISGGQTRLKQLSTHPSHHPFMTSKDFPSRPLLIKRSKIKGGGVIQSWSRAMGCLLALGATAATKMVSLHNTVNNGSKCSG